MTTQGLHCCILQSKRIGNCSNYGISSKVNSVTLMTPTGPFEPDEEHPPVWIRSMTVFGKTYYHAIPENPNTTKKHWMHGGCYISTSDSRFPFDYPIPLHDRTETQEEYDSLSD